MMLAKGVWHTRAAMDGTVRGRFLARTAAVFAVLMLAALGLITRAWVGGGTPVAWFGAELAG